MITKYVSLYLEQYRVEKGTYILPLTQKLIVRCGPGFWQVEGEETGDEGVWEALQEEWMAIGKTECC